MSDVARHYRRTTADEATFVLRDGFRDHSGTYLTDRVHSGVWISEVPFDIQGGAGGDTLLAIEAPAAVIEFYEWQEDGKSRREFLVPAEVLNHVARVAVTEDGDDDA